MALRDFMIDLMEELLRDEELALTENDMRFYDKGTTAQTDKDLDDHIRWQNARYFNADSNIVLNSMLIIRLSLEGWTEYLNYNVSDLYGLYSMTGLPEVLYLLKISIENARAGARQNSTVLKYASDYETIKEHLIIRPLNYDNSEKTLRDGIYRRIGDMALVLYISLGSEGEGDDKAFLSVMVRRDMFRKWDKDEQSVLDWALENTMRLQPPAFCYLLGERSENPETRHQLFMDDENFKLDFTASYVPPLSTVQEHSGAVAAFYPGVLERIYRMIGEDFYLAFSCTFDVHIQPVHGKTSVRAMRRGLDEMNRYENSSTDLLTRKIYRYNGRTKELMIVNV